MLRFLSKLQPYALFLLRIAVGFAMVNASWEKVYTPEAFRAGHFLEPMQHFNQFIVHLGMPAWLGYVSTVTEFFGGLCLLLGFLTRFWALMITGNMLVALITVNRHHGYSGSEVTLSLIVMSFLLLTTGSGSISLDRRLGIS